MRRWWLLLVFAAALALWLWQASPRQEAIDPGTATARQNAQPGYVAIGADLLDTGADGQPQFRLRAARIEQAAPNSEVVLTNPEFEHQGGNAWRLSAQSGVLPPATQRLQLTGNVLATSALGGMPIRIRSESLTVDLQQQQLDTAAAVSIEWGHNRLNATGIHADMKSDSLRLESHIHGEFTH